MESKLGFEEVVPEETPRLKFLRDSLQGLDKDNAVQYLAIMETYEKQFAEQLEEVCNTDLLHSNLKSAVLFENFAQLTKRICLHENLNGLRVCLQLMTRAFNV